MKKIIRIASVIALACASLVYVGCTKDFSADIAKTNSDVSALKSKVDALDATVQTINSTVANLQTTKADVTYVDAADKVLGGKIDDLTAELAKVKGTAEQAVADAAKANEAAAKVAEDLKNAKAELDSIIAGVNEKIETLEVNTDSLRKDVDSLYKNSANFSKRIDELEGRVNAIAARITSIVAVPSTVKEFVNYRIDTCTVKGEIDPASVTLDTTLFQATFAITPKAAAANIKPADVKVVVKEGLTKGQFIYQTQTVDTTLTVKKVIAEDGAITVVASGKNLGDPSEGNKLYYSLVFNGKDAADSTYEQSSQFVAAANGIESKTLANSIVFAPKEGSNIDFVKISDNPSMAILTDTLAFNGEDGLAFGKLFDNIEFKFQVNGNNLTPAEFADMIGVDVKNIAIKADTATNGVNFYTRRHPNTPADTSAWIRPVPFKVTSNGTTLVKPCNDKIGFHVTVAYDGFYVGREFVQASLWQELHYIGAKTETVTLPATSEAWTYSTWDKVTKTVSLTSGEAAKKAAKIIGTTTYTSDKFSIKKISDNGVDITVDGAARNTAAKDTTYNVEWKKNVVFSTTGENENQDSINFVINWAYTLNARPADAAIDLGSKDTVATKYSAPIAVPVKNAIDLTFAEFAKAYPVADANDTAAIKLAIKDATPVLDSVICDGKSVSGVNVAYDKVTFPATTKAGDYTVYFHSTVFGIKYSYTFVAQISRPTDIKLHATPYVSDGVATVDADTVDTPYSLKEMFFSKYLQVWSADSLAKGFEGYKVRFKAELEDSLMFAYNNDTTRGAVTYTDEANVVNGTIVAGALNWTDYRGREVKITATLVSPANDTIDAYEFTLKYQKPITSFKAGTQEVTRVAGQDTEVTLSKSFEVKGLYHGDKNIIVDTTGRFINMKNYYGIEFEYDMENAIFKVNGVETKFVKGVDYILKSEGVPTARQTITFIRDNNNKNIEANIPVILKYKYDYNHVDAYTDNLIIKVK